MNLNEGLEEMIKSYFQQLFTAGPTRTEEVLNYTPKLVTDQQNIDLLKPVSGEEVK